MLVEYRDLMPLKLKVEDEDSQVMTLGSGVKSFGLKNAVICSSDTHSFMSNSSFFNTASLVETKMDNTARLISWKIKFGLRKKH